MRLLRESHPGQDPAGTRRDAVRCSVRCHQARHLFLQAAGSAEPLPSRPLMLPVAGLAVIPLAAANRLLADWHHELGPVTRPFGSQSWALHLGAEPVSV